MTEITTDRSFDTMPVGTVRRYNPRRLIEALRYLHLPRNGMIANKVDRQVRDSLVSRLSER
jgi:hypothetical protein